MVNKVILVGNVGIDPEVRTTESGVKVARIRLATTERLFDRQANEAKEHTEWHTITLWRGLADVVDKYVRKGTQIYVEGRLRTREWMDKDNNKRYTTEILADVMDAAATTRPRTEPLPGMVRNSKPRLTDNLPRGDPSSRRRSNPPRRPFRQTIPTTCRSDAVRCARRHGGEVRKKPGRPGGAGCPFRMFYAAAGTCEVLPLRRFFTRNPTGEIWNRE